MLSDLKARVCQANFDLTSRGLVMGTFGNASGIDRDSGHVVIKPSGASYEQMRPKRMVVVSLDTGEVVEGKLRPSSDTATHLAIYRAFESVGGVVHTHSLRASAWAQARRELPPLGTTHADSFHGPVPITRELTAEEIADAYEANTGAAIVERFAGLDPAAMPAVLVAGHGPFAWGGTPEEAVNNAEALEMVAALAERTLAINTDAPLLSQAQLDKHFLRKHGPGACYGQESR